ncbi:MAG TPA: 5'/3'-nucleotidase SurE [Rhizomicrobium sp.]|nr:5'/3'-nucleotidase SurE [Rhizomicrobium sp.]
MRILVTNDDGIHAPGLAAAERIARALCDDVWVVAPETEQSGASHSLTLALPLRLRKIDSRHFAVTGTPTDCVMMAIAELMAEARPTLVLSGVNRWSNLADDVTYSGTIAGAMEGTALGVLSIALSQAYGFSAGRDVDWSCAETYGPPLIRRLVEIGWSADVLMNVNFPDGGAQTVSGIEVTVQGKRDLQTAMLDRRIDARGVPYYWISFKRGRSDPPEGTDLSAIYRKRISITPLHLNLTEFRERDRLKAMLNREDMAV